MNNNDTNMNSNPGNGMNGNNGINPNNNPMNTESLQGTSLGSINPLNNQNVNTPNMNVGNNPETINNMNLGMNSNFNMETATNVEMNPIDSSNNTNIVLEPNSIAENAVPMNQVTPDFNNNVVMDNQMNQQNMNPMNNVTPNFNNNVVMDNQLNNQNMNPMNNVTPNFNNNMVMDTQMNNQNMNSMNQVTPDFNNNMVMDNQLNNQNMNSMNQVTPDFNNNMVMDNQLNNQNMNSMNQVTPDFNNNLVMDTQMTNQNMNSMNNITPDFNNGMNNNFMGAVPTPPNMNDFGSVPPENNSNIKKKKKLSKTSIILIAILLIVIVGSVVYLVLNNLKPATTKANIATKDLIWELGNPLSKNVGDYATVTGLDVSKCTVDTSKVDITKTNAYKFSVTCGNISKEGQIVLKDTIAPVVTTKELIVAPNSTITIEDFISNCEDNTKCTYELQKESPTLEEMVAVEGEYNFNIIAIDVYNNEVLVEVTLLVTTNAPVKYLYCTGNPTNDDTLKAILEISYNYGINSDDNLATAQKIYSYTFETEEEYLNLKKSYVKTAGINGIVGNAVFDDDNFNVTLTVKKTDAELAVEFNVSSFPTSYETLKQFNLDQGITCKNK